MKLQQHQKELILDAWNQDPNLLYLTRIAFNDPSLKGSSKEGRAVRQFLIEQKLDYKTTKKAKRENPVLTEEQKKFINNHADEGMSSYEIAKLLFGDGVKKLSIEQRVVLEHIRSINPDFVPHNETGLMTDYSPPKSLSRIVKKVNDATGSDFSDKKLPRLQFICMTTLGKNLANSRFRMTINGFENAAEKELFEQEFIRLTWDKPDLSADEINLYINVCMEIIKLSQLSRQHNHLNAMFDSTETQSEVSVKLAEMTKAKSMEYNQCAVRIESLTKKLQGDRSERMKSKQKGAASLLVLTELWQDEEERMNAVRIAELQKRIVKEKADEFESMDEMLARILGVGKDDVI